MKTFAIGVSGHQNLGGEVTRDFIAERFRELLQRYRQQYTSLVVYSCVALGADQLFIQIALEQGIAVEAVLPCEDYETIFHTEEERCTYARILQASQHTHHLPHRQCSEEAFLEAGKWIVDHCDIEDQETFVAARNAGSCLTSSNSGSR